MFFKLLTVVFVVLAAAYMLTGRRKALPRRTGGQGGGQAPARVPLADDLVRCVRCGVWLPAGQGCDCAGPA